VGKVAINLLEAPVVLKVLVIGENINNELSAKEEVAPVFEGVDDGKEFTVPDGIVLFGFGERGGIVPDRVMKAVSVTLVEDGACRILRGIHLDLKGLIVVRLMKDRVSGCKGD
jgi:hypothetical protein